MADDAFTGLEFDLDNDRPSVHKIGPGSVVLIVGPSGAGKDALLQGAATQLQDDVQYVFPKRVISRNEHAAEDHEQAALDDMIKAAREGAYALSWQAHELMYGISRDIDDAVRAGSTVVFNTSRSVVADACIRYENVYVVYIDAAAKVRASRLAARGRESEQEIAKRVSRAATAFQASDADVTIENSGTLQNGIHKLVGAIKQSGVSQ